MQRVQQRINTLHVQNCLICNVTEADLRTLASLLHVSKLVTWSPTAVICPTATLGALLRCTGAYDAATAAADMATLLWCCSSVTSLVLYTLLQLVRCLAASMPMQHQPAKLENQHCHQEPIWVERAVCSRRQFNTSAIGIWSGTWNLVPLSGIKPSERRQDELQLNIQTVRRPIHLTLCAVVQLGKPEGVVPDTTASHQQRENGQQRRHQGQSQSCRRFLSQQGSSPRPTQPSLAPSVAASPAHHVESPGRGSAEAAAAFCGLLYAMFGYSKQGVREAGVGVVVSLYPGQQRAADTACSHEVLGL